MKTNNIRYWLLPAVALGLLYALLSGRTWTVDGCIMTLNTDHFMDNRSYGHLLLRPAAYLWVALWKALGVRTPEGWYHALRVLLTGFGVGALTLLFNAARRRGALAGAVAALAAIALARNALRQLALLDEKGIGMICLALAIFATARLFEGGPQEERGPGGREKNPPVPDRADEGGRGRMPPHAGAAHAGAAWGWFGVAVLWTLAVFGHLQNIPFALGFLATPLFFPGPGEPWRWRLGRAAALAGVMAAAGFLFFIALHWNVGRFQSIPLLIHNLFFKNPAPRSASLAKLWEGAVQGWIKAFFNVDRLSPRPFQPMAAAGFGLLALAAARGAWRSRRDPLAGLLLFGCLLQMVLMPLTNSYPDYGDSYTSLVLGALLLLAAAPWRLVAAGALLVGLVNLPAQWDLSHPPLTMKEHLARMEAAQLEARGAPWAALDELVRLPPNDQEFCPIYYPMDKDLEFTSCTLATLPSGACLVELPLNVERDGSLGRARIAEVERALAGTGRKVTRKQLWDPPRVIRSDFKGYGPYFEVGAE